MKQNKTKKKWFEETSQVVCLYVLFSFSSVSLSLLSLKHECPVTIVVTMVGGGSADGNKD